MVMKKTDLGLFPIDWSVSNWSSVLDGFTSGATPSRAIKDYFKGNIRWITSGELNYNVIIDTIEHISKDAVKQTNLAVHPPGTFLMAITGLEAEGTRGSCGIIGKESTTNQSCLAIYGTSRLMIPYLFYFYVKYGDWLAKHYCQGTKQQSYTASLVKQLPIIYPPSVEEQGCITEALSDIDSLISSLQKLIEKKKAIKQGAMQELLTGQKRLLGFSGEWETRKVGELCSIVTKQTGFDYTSTIKPNLIEHPQSNALPMIQTKNFEGRKFDFSTDYYIPTDIAKEFDKIVLDTVCLLFSIVGASVGNIGLFPGDKVAFCGGAIGIAKFYHEIDTIYAFYYFLSESGQQQIRNVTKGGAQATVTIEDIREFTIPYPNLEERTMIAQTLSDMDNEIEQLEKKLAKYQQIKQGMMHELLTGRIRLV